MSSSEETHWCYNCRMPVQVHWGRQAAVCSNCDGEFVHVLDDLLPTGRGDDLDDLIPTSPVHDYDDLVPTSPVHDYDDLVPNSPPEEFHGGNSSNEDELPPRYGLTETFSAFMRHQMADRSHNVVRARSDSIPEHGPAFTPVLIYRGPIPFRFSGEDVVRGGTSGDYFFGPGLEELVEQISADDRPGPPPASQSAIAAIPSVKIKNKHIKSDSSCPVCQDKFKLGSYARKLPCKHMFHEDCILPWLGQNNTCPICRHELPSEESSSSSSNRNRSSNNRSRRRSTFSFLWPFRSS